jgi:hypothetical protein
LIKTKAQSHITGETSSRLKLLRLHLTLTRRMRSRFRPSRRRYLQALTSKAINPPKAMKFSAIDAITNNLIAARFWMFVAIVFAALAVASPYLTVLAMRAKEKVVILDPGGTLIYAPLLGFEEAGQLHAYHVRLACLAFLQRNPICPDLSDLLKRLYLDLARKKAAALYQAQNAEFKEKQIHQKVEVTKDRHSRHAKGE